MDELILVYMVFAVSYGLILVFGIGKEELIKQEKLREKIRIESRFIVNKLLHRWFRFYGLIYERVLSIDPEPFINSCFWILVGVFIGLLIMVYYYGI